MADTTSYPLPIVDLDAFLADPTSSEGAAAAKLVSVLHRPTNATHEFHTHDDIVLSLSDGELAHRVWRAHRQRLASVRGSEPKVLGFDGGLLCATQGGSRERPSTRSALPGRSDAREHREGAHCVRSSGFRRRNSRTCRVQPKCHSHAACQAIIASLDPSERPLDLAGGKADPKCRFVSSASLRSLRCR